MTIATAITNAQNKVAAAYSSVNTMGGTMPATQNLSNLPTAIESIPVSNSGILETLMANVVAGNNPVDTTALATAETQIAAFLTI